LHGSADVHAGNQFAFSVTASAIFEIFARDMLLNLAPQLKRIALQTSPQFVQKVKKTLSTS